MIVSDDTRIGAWVTLPGGDGENFAIRGNTIAGAQANRLHVWRDNQPVTEIWLPRHGSGWPRWVDANIYWCDGVLEMATGTFTRFENILTVLESYSTDVNGYAPLRYSWSSDGEWLVVSLTWIGENETKPSLVLRLEKDKSDSHLLWTGNDFAPRATLVGKQWIVVGTRQPSVFQPDGDFICRLPGNL